jgi:hypothetical protein
VRVGKPRKCHGLHSLRVDAQLFTGTAGKTNQKQRYIGRKSEREAALGVDDMTEQGQSC